MYPSGLMMTPDPSPDWRSGPSGIWNHGNRLSCLDVRITRVVEIFTTAGKTALTTGAKVVGIVAASRTGGWAAVTAASGALTCTSVTVKGKNQFGRLISETISTIAETDPGTRSARVYEEITSITGAGCAIASGGDADDKMRIAVSPVVGLPQKIRQASDIISVCLSDESATPDTVTCYRGSGTVTGTRESLDEAGVDGAQPGIVMLAQPTVGEFYRQEFLEGEAEDVARVLDVDATIRSGSATYSDAIVTEDFTALEPGVVEHKAYAPGVGLVQVKTVKGGSGMERLTRVRTGVSAASIPAGKLCRS